MQSHDHMTRKVIQLKGVFGTMKIFLAVLVLAYASAEPQECAWGESYWCSSLKTAKSCGAVTHCIGTVWRTDIDYKSDNTDYCKYCENVINDVRSFISQSSAQAQKTLDAACSLIPVQQLADQCQDYVDNYLPEITQMIEAQLDPKAICACLGLCKGFADHVDHAKITQDLHRVQLSKQETKVVPILVKDYKLSGDICADCKTLIADVAKLVTDKTTESQVEQLIRDNVCSQLGGLQDQCNSLVDSYVPEILQMLSEQIDPELICGAIGFCQNGDRSLLMKMKLKKTAFYKSAVAKVNGGQYCTICTMVFTELQALDRDAKVQSQVENFLKTNLCSRLGDLAQECNDAVTQYGQIIFELLANELDPSTDCKAIGLCDATAKSDLKMQLAQKVRMSLLPMKDFGQIPAGKVPPVKMEMSKAKQSPQCVLCEFVMTELDQMLKNNQSEEEIEKALKQVCDIMPDTIKLECKDFVDQYAPAVIALLAQELSPDVVCTTLGLCNNKLVKIQKPNPVKVKNGELCGVCETVVQYVDSLLEENATREEIKQTLEKVCNFLPSQIQQECNTFIDTYAKTLIDLLEKELTPSEVCTELGLCSQINMAPMLKIVPVKAHLVGTNECTFGPSYWCATRANAKRCKTESHCEKHGYMDEH